MHAGLIVLCVVVVLFIIISAFFSCSETSLMSVNRYRLRHMALAHNHRGAQRVTQLLERIEQLLGVILIGNTVANIAASAITATIASQLFGDLGVVVSTIILTIIILIGAEIAPKTIAAIYPLRTAFLVSWPLTFLQKLLYPIVWMSNKVTQGLLRIVGVDVRTHKTVEHLSPDELRTLLREAGERIPPQYHGMLLGILDLEAMRVEDIMVPRHEIIAINLEDQWSDILTRLQTAQHTRLPVYRGSLNNIEGFVHLRKVANLLGTGMLTKETFTSTLESPYFVMEGTKLGSQLINFQNERLRVALVVDEYGDVQGLITLEDLLEEIVGEFTTNIADSDKMLLPQPDGSVLVDGGTLVRLINRMMHWTLPMTGPKTISGLVIEYMEDLPQPNCCVLLYGYPVEIMQVKDNTIKVLKIFPKQNAGCHPAA